MSEDEDVPAPKKKGLSTGAIVAIVLGVMGVLGLCVIGILATLLMPALMKARQKAASTKCASNLRQIALASIQYADDKRFFPSTNDPSCKETVELLFKFNYLDDRTTLHCPCEEGPDPTELSYEGWIAPWSAMATSNTPLVWDKKPHADGTRNVVFVDGHTARASEAEFQQLLEQAKLLALKRQQQPR